MADILLSIEEIPPDLLEYFEPIDTTNKKDVFSIATAPFSGAHFATYPPALVEPMIKAGSSEKGACPTCGAPWERVLNNPKIPKELRNRSPETKMSFKPTQVGGGQKLQDWRDANPPRTVGWQPTCACYGKPEITQIVCPDCDGTGRELVYKTELIRQQEAERTGRRDGKVSGPGGQNYKVETGEECPTCYGAGVSEGKVWPPEIETWETVPCVVLDPFAGSGTTGMVARNLGRDFIGLDLSFSYLHDQARERLMLNALDEWENGIQGKESDLAGLPMFGGA